MMSKIIERGEKCKKCVLQGLDFSLIVAFRVLIISLRNENNILIL